MNVLVDRHHAGLYRSLQLLAQRLGWTLWTPVGTDWQAAGYWAFGQNVPGLTEALARQYLEPHEGVWRRAILGWTTEDPEFPGAPIRGLALDEAKGMTWAFVVATLDDNQWGFKRFSDEVGARFVVQVGNTGQHVAWNLDPLAIVSSEVPIVGRGVRYHQEMDPAATRRIDPGTAWYVAEKRIASFVNCFPSIGSCYEVWLAAHARFSGFAFGEYGIDGAHGVIKPIAAIADRMGDALFGWHDKVHGDGFGHVIHGWAAVGRPLIGHASHYRGKMAEHFWRHGETCIDLDRVNLEEAARMARDVAQDRDRYAAMCHAIRAEFDRIDHEEEAEAIRRLLA